MRRRITQSTADKSGDLPDKICFEAFIINPACPADTIVTTADKTIQGHLADKNLADKNQLVYLRSHHPSWLLLL